jgi:hypothetical protein
MNSETGGYTGPPSLGQELLYHFQEKLSNIIWILSSGKRGQAPFERRDGMIKKD